jgi:DNA-binding NtrC family response regulator
MKKLLVVEDDIQYGEILSKYLTGKGYDVMSADGGEDAIQKVEAYPFDLVITDILMPNIDGVELRKYIKKINKDLKVIGFSGGGKIIDKEELGKMGHALFEDYLVKPFKFEDLLKLVEKNL